MIVHDSSGAKVACGIVIPPTMLVPDFAPYFDYEGDLKVQGPLFVTGAGVGDSAAQILSWSLVRVDPRCKTGAGERKNSCGIHIHEGTSCADDALDHLWNETTFRKDPWSAVGYTSHRRLTLWRTRQDGTRVAT